MLFTFIADFARTTRSEMRIRNLFEEKLLCEPTVGRVPESRDIVFENVSFGSRK